jgi:hypothetical protein
MKGKQAAEAPLGATAGEENDEEEQNWNGFHGIGMLDKGYRIQDKLIIGNH